MGSITPFEGLSLSIDADGYPRASADGEFDSLAIFLEGDLQSSRSRTEELLAACVTLLHNREGKWSETYDFGAIEMSYPSATIYLPSGRDSEIAFEMPVEVLAEAVRGWLVVINRGQSGRRPR